MKGFESQANMIARRPLGGVEGGAAEAEGSSVRSRGARGSAGVGVGNLEEGTAPGGGDRENGGERGGSCARDGVQRGASHSEIFPRANFLLCVS